MINLKKIAKVFSKVTATILIATTIAPLTAEAAMVPVYRLAYCKNGIMDNLYTTDSNEALTATVLGYTFAGTAFYASDVPDGKYNVPVYRFFNPFFLDHMYSTDNREGTSVGYSYERVEFYAASDMYANEKTLPLYRFTNGQDHYFSFNVNEGYFFGYIGEGVKFCVQNRQ